MTKQYQVYDPQTQTTVYQTADRDNATAYIKNQQYVTRLWLVEPTPAQPLTGEALRKAFATEKYRSSFAR